mmetsp:Transcript_7307/g.14563  ORF Transcript_7307/g.14563 Transcript_7307/m.14563 type:complete len:175 (-) Transcript_7307:114-638(-)|eukprot:CAMPEP_0171503866 /NCGR_PEP_ID=MMETSP0958-20121227/11182_1 /TAXON_ID=87120 /ORGANISM="Aurantiochytrium limacinum, Strain ATCCMYA-1381" /LENGTH=174 /DNA_ID=CAMNT_0012039501 /DNA_START=87 /DNA_END=611 /DNA_ORIENTATION=+
MASTKERFAGAMPEGAKTEELLNTFCGKNVLFFIERDSNCNAVIYEANIGADGKLDPSEPVKVYWILYARDPIVEEGLTLIERNTAYGSKTVESKEKPGHYIVTLSALPEKQIHVFQDEAGVVHAITKIDGVDKELLHVFVTTTTNMIGIPKVKHIDIKGRGEDGGLSVERKMN